jgi:F-type H+-transporting ATPase subunit delta
VRGQSRPLARRYARAALDVAAAQHEDAPAALARELSALAALVEANAELRRVVDNPGLARDVRRRVLAAVLRAAGASPLLLRLVELLQRHERLAILTALAEEYQDALARREGRFSAEAVTAVPLAPAQRGALTEALRSLLGRAVELKARVDPAVLGGVRVTLGGRTYDGTVRARLGELRRRLASGSPRGQTGRT